jgi:putative transposase
MSGYLAHSHGKPSSKRKQQDQRLLVYIRSAHARGRGIYGPIKIQTELAAHCVMAGINRIKRLCTLHGIRCTHKKKFRVTTDSKHLMPVARNLLDRQFACTAPNQVWVADITYIPTGEAGCI